MRKQKWKCGVNIGGVLFYGLVRLSTMAADERLGQTIVDGSLLADQEEVYRVHNTCS